MTLALAACPLTLLLPLPLRICEFLPEFSLEVKMALLLLLHLLVLHLQLQLKLGVGACEDGRIALGSSASADCWWLHHRHCRWCFIIILSEGGAVVSHVHSSGGRVKR